MNFPSFKRELAELALGTQVRFRAGQYKFSGGRTAPE
jgi:hypothetical protein